MKIRPQSAVRLLPSPALADAVPVFQADPAAPPGSVRVLRFKHAVDLQNFNDRATSVGVVFIKPDTIESVMLFTKALKEPKENDPP